MRTISAPFGPHSDAQWRFLTETWVRRDEDGSWRPHYDTRIAEVYRATMPEKDLEIWHIYDAVRCPTLLVRGEHSDVVSRQTAAEMARRGPKAKVVRDPRRRPCADPIATRSDRAGPRFPTRRRDVLKKTLLLLVVAATPAFAQQSTLDAVRSKGYVQCGVNGRAVAGFSAPDSQGRLEGNRRRPVPRGRGGGVRRLDQGALHAAHRAAALHRAAVGRGRHPVAQHHLDHHARHQPRAQLRRRQLLRRPGLHGAPQAQREERQAAERRHRVRAAGHHHRAQPVRLLPRQQDELQAGGDRDAAGGSQRLFRGALRRLHHRPLGPDLDARLARAQARGPHHPAGDHLQGAARAGGAPRRRPLVRRGEVDACSRCWKPRRWA